MAKKPTAEHAAVGSSLLGMALQQVGALPLGDRQVVMPRQPKRLRCPHAQQAANKRTLCLW